MERVVVRHLRGSKANNIEQFPVDTFKELLIGRDQTAAISFDPDQDDLVSRRHALIRIHKRDKLSFTILDLQSSNGTFLNGERLEREGELLVEDRVQLGSGGPEFAFDVEPRPAGMVARTRMFSASDVPHTRLSETRVPIDVGAPTYQESPRQEKVGVGKDTVERMLGAERKAAGRKWMYAAAAGILGIALVGGFSYQAIKDAEAKRIEAEQKAEAEAKAQAAATAAKYGRMTPENIMAEYGAASVFIEAGWKAFDPASGLPVFQKIIDNKPVFVSMDSGEIVPWLTTDDENQTNRPIGSPSFRGSGFVITQNGFILTNRHVAASWMTRLDPLPVPSLLVSQNSGAPKKWKQAPPAWVPDAGYLFKKNKPILLYSTPVPLEGRNHTLDVTFPKNKLRVPARLVRVSDRHDVALIKVDMPRDVPKVNLVADDYEVATGQRVVILGYPAVSYNAVYAAKSEDWFNPNIKVGVVPEPTVTDAIVSKQISSQQEVIGDDQIRFGGATLTTSYYQLSTSATGAGNSGGPVFNTDGEIIGIFTAGATLGGANVTYAVPISFGKELLTTATVSN